MNSVISPHDSTHPNVAKFDKKLFSFDKNIFAFDKNYFHSIKIYFHSIKIYFHSIKIFFHSIKRECHVTPGGMVTRHSWHGHKAPCPYNMMSTPK